VGAHAELVHVGLADDVGAAGAQLTDDGGLEGRGMAEEDARGALRGEFGGRDVVLDGEAEGLRAG